MARSATTLSLTTTIILGTILVMLILPFIGVELIGGLALHLAVIAMTGAIASALTAAFEKE